jgi:hypothetical protein
MATFAGIATVFLGFTAAFMLSAAVESSPDDSFLTSLLCPGLQQRQALRQRGLFIAVIAVIAAYVAALSG